MPLINRAWRIQPSLNQSLAPLYAKLAIQPKEVDCGSAAPTFPNKQSPTKLKCSTQICVRGLKSGTSTSSIGSIAETSEPLFRLHLRHASARLSPTVLPPCLTAITGREA